MVSSIRFNDGSSYSISQKHRANPAHRTGKTETEPGWDYEKWKKESMEFAVKNIPGWVDEVKARYGG